MCPPWYGLAAMRTSTALILFLACPAFAAAQLRFDQSAANLGELRGGLAYGHRFDFVNEGQGPVEITDIRLGCGCLAPVLDQRVYQAGAKGTLLMHIRTLGQPEGPRTWQAHVQYRHAGKLNEATLVLAARIRNEITIEPSIIAMTVKTTLKQELRITDHRSKAMTVSKVLASSPAIHVAVQPINDGATRVILEVSGAALTSSRQEETIHIYTDDPHYRHLQVPITLLRAEQADVTAVPSRVELIGAGSQLVRLRTAGEKAVRIDKVDVDLPTIKCTWAVGPGNDATLKIAAPSTSVDAQTNVRVHIGATVLTIPVTLRRE